MINFSTYSSAKAPQAIAQLKTLYHLAITEREAERQQVAAYLNDTTVQTLSALHIHLTLLHTAPEAQLRHELTQELLRLVDLITSLTQLARELRPLELDSFGLHEALQLAVESFSQADGKSVRYEGSSVPDLPSTVATALFRLAQTALMAMQSNSQANEGLLHLHATPQGASLTIRDNDKGVVSTPDIVGLMVYFEQLNGRITHQVQPGVGTTITAVWPWPDEPLQNSSGCNPVQYESG